MLRKFLRHTGKRYLIGLLGPLILGSILLYLIEPILGVTIDAHSNVVELLLYSSNEPFVFFMPTIFIIAFMLLGVQSIAYCFLMEHIVLRYVRDKYKVIMISVVLCLLFPFFSFISLARPGDPAYIIDGSFYLVGAMTGFVVGYLLYHIYELDMQYAQQLLLKKEAINKNKFN